MDIIVKGVRNGGLPVLFDRFLSLSFSGKILCVGLVRFSTEQIRHRQETTQAGHSQHCRRETATEQQKLKSLARLPRFQWKSASAGPGQKRGLMNTRNEHVKVNHSVN